MSVMPRAKRAKTVEIVIYLRRYDLQKDLQSFLGLILKIFNELHQVSSLTDQLLIGHPLLLLLVLERVKLLLKIWVSLLHHWHRIELSWNHLGIWVFITRLS